MPSRLYRIVLHGLSGLAGILMGLMMLSIVLDVVLRNLGSQSSAHIFTFNEYFLFLIPLLGAPLLVREKGQIYVEALLMQFPAGARRQVVRLILLLCVITCAVLAWYSAGLAYTDFNRNELDVRSLDMPRWMLTAFMPVSFGLMAIEFARFFVRGEDPYQTAGGAPPTH